MSAATAVMANTDSLKSAQRIAVRLELGDQVLLVTGEVALERHGATPYPASSSAAVPSQDESRDALLWALITGSKSS